MVGRDKPSPVIGVHAVEPERFACERMRKRRRQDLGWGGVELGLSGVGVGWGGVGVGLGCTLSTHTTLPMSLLPHHSPDPLAWDPDPLAWDPTPPRT